MAKFKTGDVVVPNQPNNRYWLTEKTILAVGSRVYFYRINETGGECVECIREIDTYHDLKPTKVYTADDIKVGLKYKLKVMDKVFSVALISGDEFIEYFKDDTGLNAHVDTIDNLLDDLNSGKYEVVDIGD